MVLLIGLVLLPQAAQGQTFTESNLPILVIDTEGNIIVDEPKVRARMTIIDNGPGAINQVTDLPTDYDGFVGIEYRGSSSQALFPKKSFAVETRTPSGDNNNVELLGMPRENDWVLYGPYSDKSLLRNVLAYDLAWRLGHYASRTRLVEVVLNGEYWGVYVFAEKIKRDGDRVDVTRADDLATAGDELTGGYIIKVDKQDGAEVGGWNSTQPAFGNSGRLTFYQYHYPDPDDITPAQQAYIQNLITQFEAVMASDTFADPVLGYASMIDVGTFVDYFLINELARNIDGFRLSAFMYKDRDSIDPRLKMGPIWDFNLGFGNANYYNGQLTQGFNVTNALPLGDFFQRPFWWPRLVEDSTFVQAAMDRWNTLRTGPLHTDSLHQFIDDKAAYLEDAQRRNFQRWPVLGTWIWPNDFIGSTYDAEVDYLKDWHALRAAWMDTALPALLERQTTELPPVGPGGFALTEPFPNPFTDAFETELVVDRPQFLRVAVYDVLGREVAVLFDSFASDDTVLRLHLDATGLAPGTYILDLRSSFFRTSRLLTRR